VTPSLYRNELLGETRESTQLGAGVAAMPGGRLQMCTGNWEGTRDRQCIPSLQSNIDPLFQEVTGTIVSGSVNQPSTQGL